MYRYEIENKANQVLKDHGMLKYPVDPLLICQRLGIKVMNADFSESNISGAIAERNGTTTIYVKNTDHPARKRFTIAHELGHFLLHFNDHRDHEILDNIDDFRIEPQREGLGEWSSEKRREWEANAFAAALLMDKSLVSEAWEQYNDEDYMAWLFQVSEGAMKNKIIYIAIIGEIKMIEDNSNNSPDFVTEIYDEVDLGYWQPKSLKEWSHVHKLKSILKMWEKQQNEERILRKRIAYWVFILISAQIALVFFLILLDSYDKIEIKEIVIKLLIPSVFGEIFGMGFLVVKYLFDKSNRNMPEWLNKGDV